MVENDALVELIQTTEVPRGYTYVGTKGLSALPPRYGDPFYTGRGRCRGGGRGRREWLNERPYQERDKQRVWKMVLPVEMEEDFILQAPSERDQRDRQEKEWSIPVQVLEEEVETFLFHSLQNENCHIELHLLLLPLRIAFSEIGVV